MPHDESRKEEGNGRDDPDVEPRYGDDVRRPRPVEFVHHFAGYLALLAEDRGLDDLALGGRCIFSDCLAQAVPVTFEARLQNISAPRPDHDKTGLVQVTPRPDTLAEEITSVIEPAGVVEIMGFFELCLEADVIAVSREVGGVPRRKEDQAFNRRGSVLFEFRIDADRDVRPDGKEPGVFDDKSFQGQRLAAGKKGDVPGAGRLMDFMAGDEEGERKEGDE